MTSSPAAAPGTASPNASPSGPSLRAGLAIYAGYLAVFFTTWAVNGADYMHIGETVESTRLHYAYPTLFASLFAAGVLTARGWWTPVLFDRTGSGPSWAWVGPAAMLLLAVRNLAGLNPGGATAELVLWSVLGGVGVGFGEETITRGALLAGLRTGRTEAQSWLLSTLAFSAMHVPNMFFGLPAFGVPGQVLLTFIMGSMLWATRRLSRTLLVPMFLHGLWDTSVFLPRATGASTDLMQFLVFPIAIACVVAVLRWERSVA